MTSSASDCIAAYRDDHGFVWIYKHSDDEPHDTLVAAIMIAGEVAAVEAAKDGKTYVVASTNAPSVAVYALPFGHPMISNKALSIMYQIKAGGQCIRMPKPQKH